MHLLVVQAERSAEVQIANESTGYLQVTTFDDPQTCDQPKLVGYIVKPSENRQHLLPAGKPITLLVTAFGLPAPVGQVAWCRPQFLSTRLSVSGTYRIAFRVDAARKTCGVDILDQSSGKPLPWFDGREIRQWFPRE